MDEVLSKDTIEFGDELDLHCFSPSDTAFLVDYFLRSSFDKGMHKVRIIHGKGKSVKKKEVLQILSSHPLVAEFSDDSFNWGATTVKLVESKEPL
jgi:DNA-nicking Smr family endonuclease